MASALKGSEWSVNGHWLALLLLRDECSLMLLLLSCQEEESAVSHCPKSKEWPATGLRWRHLGQNRIESERIKKRSGIGCSFGLVRIQS